MSYILGTQILATPGSYLESFTSAGGCDSIVILALTVLPSYNENISVRIYQKFK